MRRCGESGARGHAIFRERSRRALVAWCDDRDRSAWAARVARVAQAGSGLACRDGRIMAVSASGKSAGIFDAMARPGNRSPLFWWMVEHHNEVVASLEGRRMNWKALCARFAELGLTDLTGTPATERSARQTWGRARKEKGRIQKWREDNEVARVVKEAVVIAGLIDMGSGAPEFCRAVL